MLMMWFTRTYMALRMPFKNKFRELNITQSFKLGNNYEITFLMFAFGVAWIGQWIFNYGRMARTMVNVDTFMLVGQFCYSEKVKVDTPKTQEVEGGEDDDNYQKMYEGGADAEAEIADNNKGAS